MRSQNTPSTYVHSSTTSHEDRAKESPAQPNPTQPNPTQPNLYTVDSTSYQVRTWCTYTSYLVQVHSTTYHVRGTRYEVLMYIVLCMYTYVHIRGTRTRYTSLLFSSLLCAFCAGSFSSLITHALCTHQPLSLLSSLFSLLSSRFSLLSSRFSLLASLSVHMCDGWARWLAGWVGGCGAACLTWERA